MITDEEYATEHITQMFGDEIKLKDYESSEAFGLVKLKDTNKANVKSDQTVIPLIVGGEADNEDDAWDKFWNDFAFQVKGDLKNKKIIWRRHVNVDSYRDLDSMATTYRVVCRLGIVEPKTT